MEDIGSTFPFFKGQIGKRKPDLYIGLGPLTRPCELLDIDLEVRSGYPCEQPLSVGALGLLSDAINKHL